MENGVPNNQIDGKGHVGMSAFPRSPGGYELKEDQSVRYTRWVILECGGSTPLLLAAA